MPEEVFENWLKITLAAVLGFGLLAGAAYAGYWYGTESAKPPASPSGGQLKTQNQIIPTPTPAPLFEITPTPTPSVTDPTANWKTYSSPDMSFKYPSDWVESGYLITSSAPKVRLVVVPKDSTLMTECMQETAVEDEGGFVIRKFSRVTTGAMCGTSDATPREIWIMKSLTTYAPGISYQYSSTESSQAESMFDQILSTFKFLD